MLDVLLVLVVIMLLVGLGVLLSALWKKDPEKGQAGSNLEGQAGAKSAQGTQGAKGSGSALDIPGGAADKCSFVYSELEADSALQWNGNPDADMGGFVTCELCTGGKMHCTLLNFAGSSQIQAAVIHAADASNEALINFCGVSGEGAYKDGKFKSECNQWTDAGAAHGKDMEGVLVEPASGSALTVAQRVQDIAKRPSEYYFTVHTQASVGHWPQKQLGAVRGKLSLQAVQDQ